MGTWAFLELLHPPLFLIAIVLLGLLTCMRFLGLPWWLRWKRIHLQCRRPRFNPWGREDPLEQGMATHSSVLTWRIPWTEEPGGLQSMGSQRVGHDWVTKNTHMHAFSKGEGPYGAWSSSPAHSVARISEDWDPSGLGDWYLIQWDLQIHLNSPSLKWALLCVRPWSRLFEEPTDE